MVDWAMNEVISNENNNVLTNNFFWLVMKKARYDFFIN